MQEERTDAGERPRENGGKRLEPFGQKPRGAWSPQMLEETGRTLLQSLQRAQPCQQLGFRLLASRTVREYMSVGVTQFVKRGHGSSRKPT